MEDGTKCWRQGDVLVIQTDHIPENAQLQTNTVVAHGEATGHSHRFEVGAERFVGEFGVQYIRVLSEWADLVHEEHGTIRLERGTYRITIQREYWPDRSRPVVD